MNTDEVAVTAKATNNVANSSLNGITLPRGFRFKTRYWPLMNLELKNITFKNKLITSPIQH